MQNKKILPPAYFFAAILGILVLHFLFPVMKIVPSPWNALGIIFLLGGAILELLGARLFRQAGTTIKPGEESSTLVTNGVFRISRNPMYLGFVFLLTGVAFFTGSLSPFLVIPIFVFLIRKVFITTEEAMLEKKFGPAWLDYKKRVRRWI